MPKANTNNWFPRAKQSDNVRKGWAANNDQPEVMIKRFAKTILTVLLGFILALQSVPAVSASAAANTSRKQSSCCCTGCDSKHCSTPVCCAKPADDSRSPSPAPLSTSQNERQALAASVASALTLPLFLTDEFALREPSSVSMTAIPIFKRNCSYLI